MSNIKASSTDGWRIAELMAIGLTFLGFALHFGRMTEQQSAIKKEVEQIRILERQLIQMKADLDHTRKAYAEHMLNKHQNQRHRYPYSPTRGPDPRHREDQNSP